MDLGYKAVAAVSCKGIGRGSAAVGVVGGGEVRRGGGKAAHGNVGAGGVHCDAVPLGIVVPAKKAGVNQRVWAALGGVDDAQAGVSRAEKIETKRYYTLYPCILKGLMIISRKLKPFN